MNSKKIEVEPYLPGMDKLFKAIYDKFEKSKEYVRDDLPKYAGVYAFYDKGNPIYVGRTNKIRERIQYHTRSGSGIESATFAFNLAKVEFLKSGRKKFKLRKEYLNNKEFVKLFHKHKNQLHNCTFKCVEIENDILQAMFEPYLAYKLETYPENNTFENH